MSVYETLIYEIQDNVALITMNRPDKRNALNATLNADLLSAFQQAQADETIRAVVLTGAGKGFCAGADLTAVATIPTPDDIYNAIVSAYVPLMTLITTLKKPVIAAINGAAAGAGMSLALACDLQVMAHNASLMMAFSNIAFVPDAGAAWFLMRQIGYSRAYQMAIEGQHITAEQCRNWGLANKVVPADHLLEETLAWAKHLAQRPTLALGLTKHTLQFAAQNSLSATIEYEASLQKQTIASHDFQEGVMAFMQKREPEFKGK
ncbi:MAG: enoyl-CoA hydratase/isomerase family protein [Anaerolineae bacterium]|nr:enoyl-CoA hydratase/isomerase family protein [Anaerolineae bacterium]